jgi:hypothetical protein
MLGITSRDGKLREYHAFCVSSATTRLLIAAIDRVRARQKHKPTIPITPGSASGLGTRAKQTRHRFNGIDWFLRVEHHPEQLLRLMVRSMAYLLLLLAPWIGSAQGTVTFVNYGAFITEGVDRLVYISDESGDQVPLVGTNWVAQLYYGSDAASFQPHTAAPSRFRPVGTASPGTWVGGTRPLTGFTVTQIVTMQVKVWDIRDGATFELACQDGHMMGGESGVFTYLIPVEDARCAAVENVEA